MNRIKWFIVAFSASLTGNLIAQRLLAKIAFFANYLMGVGAGADTSASGEFRVLRKLQNDNNAPLVIFDVGANKGQFLRLALQETESELTQIHCFEPSKVAFESLSDSYGSCVNVRLNNTALAAEQGDAVLYYDQPGSGLASLTKRRLEHFGMSHVGQEPVVVNTLDEYCMANGIERIDLLKIDVEGHELDVLRGATDMFEKGAVAAVTFEFGGCNIDTRTFFQDYWYFFKTINMQIYRLTPTGYTVQIESYAEEHEQFVTTNFVALRE